MPQRNVATNFTFEQQRGEINNLAQDYWTFQSSQTTLNSTWLKLDGSNAFTGGTLAVPNAFTINSNSGAGTLTIAGNLQVNGTTTTVNTATMDVVDKNITIAKGSANDAAADGAGITIDSATDITFNFVDAKDALVSSIGLEATTTLVAGGLASLQGARFAGTQTPSAGVGVEITQPDANTGNIQAYDRTNSAFKDLRLKGASVGFYAGSTNALVGAFHNTGLTMESGKGITIPGSLDVDGTTDLDVTNVDGALTMMAGWNLAFQNGFNNKTSAIVNSGASGKSNLEFKVDDGNGLVKRLSILNTGTVRVNKGSGIGMALVPANNTDTFQIQFDLADTTNKGYVNYDFNTDKMKFRAGGTGEILTLLNGSVGINSGSPTQAVLEVQGNTAYASSANSLATAVTNSAFRVKGSNNSSDSLWMGVETSDANPYIQGANDPGNATKKLLLNPFGGNVGIGTVSPTQLLEINGASSPCVLLKDTTNDVIAYLFSDDSTAYVGSASNHPVVIKQNNGTAIQIDTSKNVSFNGTLDIPAVQGANNNHNSDVLFQDSNGVIDGGSGLTYNPAEDALKVNGTIITAGGINGAGASCVVAAANHSSTCMITVGSVITTKADIVPDADNADDLGSSSKRWANVYTADLQMNNTGTGGNEVDGSEGRWTMQEGADDLFLINRNTGKKYKFNLTEVS